MTHVPSEMVLEYLQGTLAAEARGEVDRHIDECTECRRLIAESAPTEPPRSGPASELAAQALPTVPVDNYIIEEEVARGGLGKILRARHVPLDRTVAVKELIRQSSMSLDGRFVREALVTAGLQHPGIVPLYEAGRWPTGELFYAMKLVDGETLAARLRALRSFAERVALLPNLIAVGEALAYAHSRGIIHRDIKPSNIILGEFGETVLIDWGLAKRLADDRPAPPDRDVGATLPGDVIGTPLYMAPEQTRGEPADTRSDVYSLGVVIYESLAGCVPYNLAPRGARPDEFLRRIPTQPAVPLDARVRRAPRDLVTIVHKALAHDPADRYPSARELVEDLKRFQTGQLVSAREYSSWQLMLRWARRHRTPLAIAAAAALALIVLGALSVVRIARARHKAESSVAQLHLDQGRLANLGGDPMRALVYLSAAAGEGKDDARLRFLLRRAEQSLERRRLVLPAHTAAAIAAYSPDGSRIATASHDKSAAVWDARTGSLLHRMSGHEGRIVALAWSPDGRRLATAAQDRTARVWDADSGAPVATLVGHDGRVNGVAWSPDGSRLLTRSEDGTARTWDAAGGALLTIRAHEGETTGAIWLPDGRIATAGADKTARVWAADGTPACVARGHTRGLSALAVSPAGDRLATGAFDRAAAIWTIDCRMVHELVGHRDGVLRVAFDPAGLTVVTAGADGSAKLWHAGTGRLVASLDGHGGGVVAAGFNHDGTQVLTGSDDRTARIWRTADGRLESVLAGHVAEVRSATFSPDGKDVLVAGRDGTAVVWDARPEGLLDTIAAGSGPVILARFLPDGRVLAVSDAGDGVCPPMRPDSRNWATHCELSGDGRVVLRAEGDRAAAAERGTRAESGAAVHPAEIQLHALTPAGERAVTGSSDGTVLVWETAGGRVLLRTKVAGTLRAVAIAPDGATLVVHTSDDMTVWDVASASVRRTFSARAGRFSALEFDARGERLVGPTLDGGAAIWDVRTGAAKVALEAPPTTTVAAVFSPDGAFVAAAGQDNRTRVYDAVGGTLLLTIAHGGTFCAPQFSPDSTRLVTAGTDGTARVWDVSLDRRDVPAIADYVRCRVPFRLEREALWPSLLECR
ncbi:MAG TPA: protein kinase [Haliangiales bacterium]|nr:protein kinase [Haliangiales bacterium]